MIRFHGTPITPRSVLAELAGRNFCVSYAAPRDAEWCHSHGQSVMLDNGAFTFWKQSTPTSPEWWGAYAEWAEKWLEYPTTWAVIPDVIDGSEEDNDYLILKWPRRLFDQSAPVWHMHESLERLTRLANSWSRICIGSSSQYATLGTPAWHRRMEQVFNRVCGNGPPPVWIHMLRGMAFAGGPYPFASVDSTDVARNHNRPQNGAAKMAMRWDSTQPSPRWRVRDQLALQDL